MYHSIAEDLDDTVPPYYRIVTSPQTFETHMALLREAGCEVLTLSEAVWRFRSVSGGSSLPGKPVVITFDDGFRDFHTTAFPILERFGFRATVFLISGYIDKTLRTGRECLRKREIQRLATEGVEFGSHTVNHPRLQELSEAAIVHELAASRDAIENIIGTEVRLFSYPYRFPAEDTRFIRLLSSLLTEQKYSAGVTTVIGSARASENVLFLKRLPVNDADDRKLLRAKLTGAYDWVRIGQLLYKRLRRIVSELRPA